MEDLKRVKIILRSWFQVPPMPVRKYLEEIHLAVMPAAKSSAGFAPEVNVREYVKHMPLASVNKAAHSGFETQRCQQKSKIEPQKGLFSSYLFLKIIFTRLFTVTTVVIKL